MKLSGYVQRLDIDPDFTIEYNEEKSTFNFILSLHGVYVGKKQAEWISGIDGTVMVPTQKSKSQESLQDQELRFKQR